MIRVTMSVIFITAIVVLILIQKCGFAMAAIGFVIVARFWRWMDHCELGQEASLLTILLSWPPPKYIFIRIQTQIHFTSRNCVTGLQLPRTSQSHSQGRTKVRENRRIESYLLKTVESKSGGPATSGETAEANLAETF